MTLFWLANRVFCYNFFFFEQKEFARFLKDLVFKQVTPTSAGSKQGSLTVVTISITVAISVRITAKVSISRGQTISVTSVTSITVVSISFRCSLRSSLSLPLYHIMRGSKESLMTQNSSVGISKMTYGSGCSSHRFDSMRKGNKGIVIEAGMTIDSRTQDSRQNLSIFSSLCRNRGWFGNSVS